MSLVDAVPYTAFSGVQWLPARRSQRRRSRAAPDQVRRDSTEPTPPPARPAAAKARPREPGPSPGRPRQVRFRALRRSSNSCADELFQASVEPPARADTRSPGFLDIGAVCLIQAVRSVEEGERPNLDAVPRQ